MKYLGTYDKLVLYLLSFGREGEYWDFKQEWHKDISELIKDIVCFTNTVHNKDCYLIFGIADDLEITGMKNIRRKQSDIIDAISNLQFSGDIFPKIELNTTLINGLEIDILTIFNENKTPIFLKKNYGVMNAGCIYSRIGDKNTPNNGNADSQIIEDLWKKRFGLLKPPIFYIYDRLGNKDEWERLDDIIYNIYKPEYVLEIVEDEEELSPEFYAFAMPNFHTVYENLNIKYQTTILETHQLVILDSGRLSVPVPEWGYFKVNSSEIFCYKFYVRDSKVEKLLKFFYDKSNTEQYYAMQNLLRVVIFYESKEEQFRFEQHVLQHIELLKEQISQNAEFDYLDVNSKQERCNIERLRMGSILNVWLNDWRKQNNN